MSMNKQINCSFCRMDLSSEELKAASSICDESPHITLQLLPNHHMGHDSELNGYVLRCNKDDKSGVIPLNRETFHLTSLYECMPNEDDFEANCVFNETALHILNNLPEYKNKLKQVVSEIEHNPDPRYRFDCICEMNLGYEDRSNYTHVLNDHREWCESVPSKVGLYHMYLRDKCKGLREHRLFVVVQGCLTNAAEELYNLWTDIRQHTSAHEFVSSEEVFNLRHATQRNHNRIAALVCQKLKIPADLILDMDDASQSHNMMRPICSTFDTDLRISSCGLYVDYVRNGTFLENTTGGVLFDLCANDGFWVLNGPSDNSDVNVFGGLFVGRTKALAFPTQSVVYNKQNPPIDASNVISFTWNHKINHLIFSSRTDTQHEDSEGGEDDLENTSELEYQYLFPHEHFFDILQKMGYNRNNGVQNVMPLLSHVQASARNGFSRSVHAY